ncbi:spermatogenesis-associated protein 1 isoform X4 [Acinonyx jubatus]|uniref:Spermatogenesis-associated protein 1 isoform X4 n=1 Tax=Acinonyx jubatus TaxID=32536 RepID=A0ABM3PF55_ACIJB|nr:spermatogenesis-associated protein 1 isoform X4 [Acinonyx jubatus]
MKKGKTPHKIPTDNHPIQTLVNMSLSPSRPSSSELVELHVFYVPEGSWNYKLNTISIEVVNKFISAGFIRVSPHLTLQALRERLSEFLGEDAVAEKFLFLKCIGNNLAVVKAKRESELKLKSFVPPYAFPRTGDEVFHSFLSAGGKATPKGNQTGKNQIGNSEVPGSSEESNSDLRNKKSLFLWKNEDDRVNTIRTENNQIGKKECITLPDLIDFPSLPCQPALSPVITDISLLQIEREKIIEQLKQVKKERRYLERIREELIKKVEKLFEQSKLKQCHACDDWKKKYFETKKITASLEEVLTKLREDLELYYKKLLMQLEARDIKMRPKNLANITDSKNYLIIQITEVQHAIDQLKRKLDTDKMKLIMDAKVRKQAVSDLCMLKTELAQKKNNTSVQPQLVPGNVPN